MSETISPYNIGKALCLWLGVDPEKVSAITIVAEVGAPTIVDIAWFQTDDVPELPPKRYKLVPLDE